MSPRPLALPPRPAVRRSASVASGLRTPARGDLSEVPQLDGAEVDLVAVVLQHDVPTTPRGKALDLLELAGGDERVHACRAEVEYDHLRAVEPMLAVRPLEHDPGLVPLAHGAQLVRPVARDEIVQTGRTVRRQLAVLVQIIVEHLVLEADGRVVR